VHNLLQGEVPPRMPYLVHEIEAWLDARLVVDADAISLTPNDSLPQANTELDALAAASHHPNLPGMVPGETHANRVHPK
jgi:hypothetical protein